MVTLYHPSLFALFRSPLTDQAEIRASVAMQLKIAPKQKQVKGQHLYSGLGTEDFGDLYFNTNSNITSRLMTLKVCDTNCRDTKLERDSTSLVGGFAGCPMINHEWLLGQRASPGEKSLNIVLDAF